MNIDLLIEILTEYRDQFGPDAEVRIMTQQNWPFENSIHGVTCGEEMNECDEAEEDADDEDVADVADVADDAVVYIVEGQQLGYGSSRAWDTARDC
jgi:hypothetical protein